MQAHNESKALRSNDRNAVRLVKVNKIKKRALANKGGTAGESRPCSDFRYRDFFIPVTSKLT